VENDKQKQENSPNSQKLASCHALRDIIASLPKFNTIIKQKNEKVEFDEDPVCVLWQFPP
jgi:hypothetical protein